MPAHRSRGISPVELLPEVSLPVDCDVDVLSSPVDMLVEDVAGPLVVVDPVVADPVVPTPVDVPVESPPPSVRPHSGLSSEQPQTSTAATASDLASNAPTTTR
jgi:hypothetical protein